MTQGARGRPVATEEGAASRDRVLCAALHLFARLGYHEANVRRIGENAGLDHALVIRHFGNKAQLFATALTQALVAAGASSEDDRPEAMRQVARLMLASAYAPREVRQSVVRIVSEHLDCGASHEQTALAPEGLGDVVCAQLAELLLTLRDDEDRDAAVLGAQMYGHLGRRAAGGDRVPAPPHRGHRRLRLPPQSSGDERQG